jgi:hypothetical protein
MLSVVILSVVAPVRTWLAGEGEVEPGVRDEVGHGAGVIGGRVGQKGHHTRGLVRIDLNPML